jgi:hypothetical protein
MNHPTCCEMINAWADFSTVLYGPYLLIRTELDRFWCEENDTLQIMKGSHIL